MFYCIKFNEAGEPVERKGYVHDQGSLPPDESQVTEEQFAVWENLRRDANGVVTQVE